LREMRGPSLLLPFLKGFTTDYGKRPALAVLTSSGVS